MIVVMVGVVVVGLVFMRRAAKRRLVAGLETNRPAFWVEPSKRWSTTGRDHRL